MNLGGWLFMGASWAVIIGMVAWTMSRILREKETLVPGHADPPSGEE